MKKHIILSIFIVSLLGLSSCRDYITELSPGTQLLEDFFVSGSAAEQSVTA